MTRSEDLTQGSVVWHVWRMGPPMVVAFLAMMAFNLADTWFVSRLGTASLAAMGFTFPIIMLFHSIAMGIGLGVSSCVSHAIGSRDYYRVQHLATYSFLLTFLVMGLLTVVSALSLDPLLAMLGAGKDTTRLATSYLHIWFFFAPFGALPMVGNNAIRATGDTFWPSVIMGVAALFNVILDPILIFGWGPIPAMGIPGAALATGVARLLSLFWGLWIMHHKCHLITLDWTGFIDMFRAWGSILRIALPSAATNLLMPMTMGIVTRLIAGFGEEAVAATTAGQRIEQFTYLVPMAMGSTLVPIIGQNWGAGRIDRVREVWIKTNWYGGIYGVACLILTVFLGHHVAALFSHNPNIIQLIYRYLLIMLTGSILQHSFVHTGFAFNAIQKPLHASLLTIIRFVIFVIPLSWLGSRWLGLLGVYMGIALATTISGVLAMVWFNRTFTDEKKGHRL